MSNIPLKRNLNRVLQSLHAGLSACRHGGQVAALCLQQAAITWYRQDFPLIGYLFKYLLAAFLALWLALKMEMDQPTTALLTVVIVMHFRAGMVMTKSYYRLIGTIVGLLFSMLLVAWFAQDRFPFFIAAALWIGVCTAGSMVYRNFQSYAFVLAGYTLCIVGLPATLAPWHTFQIASTRLSEIAVGLLSASLVSELILPQRLWENIQLIVRAKFRDFSFLLGTGAAAEFNAPLLKFMQDLSQLETFRASIQFEPDDARVHDVTMHQLSVQFMAVSTTYVVFQRMVRRLQTSGHVTEAKTLLALIQPLATAMLSDGQSASSAPELVRLQQAVAAYRQQVTHALQQSLQSLAHATEITLLEVESGAALLQRLATELSAYLETYALLVLHARIRPQSQTVAAETPMQVHIDWVPVAIAAVRGAMTLSILAAIWMSIDWPSGILAMTLGVITSTLFAASPAPMATMRQFAVGVLLGILLVYVSNVFWLTAAHDYVMLCIVITPAILLTAWLGAKPATALLGAGLGIAYFLMVGFNQALGDNPVRYFNDSIALMVALGVSGMMFSLTDFAGSLWAKARVLSQLRQLVVQACRDPAMTAIALEMRARDLVMRAGHIHRPQAADSAQVVEAMCATLEIGHALITLRESAQTLSVQPHKLLQHTIARVAHCYQQPGQKNQQQALQWLDQFLAWLHEAEHTDVLPAQQARKFIMQLHLIRLVIVAEAPQDQVSVTSTQSATHHVQEPVDVA